MMHNRYIFLFLSLLLLQQIGCGKKDMPVPPRKKAPYTVNDLNFKIEQNILILNWSKPELKGISDNFNIAGYFLYKYTVDLNTDICEKCPINFKKFKYIPFENNSLKQIIFKENLEKGYYRVYKVVTISKDGLQSKDSNYIYIKF